MSLLDYLGQATEGEQVPGTPIGGPTNAAAIALKKTQDAANATAVTNAATGLFKLAPGLLEAILVGLLAVLLILAGVWSVIGGTSVSVSEKA